MQMAPSYVAGFVSLLAVIFPDIGIDALNTTANTIIILVSSIVVMYRQIKSGRSTFAGTRPE